MSIVIIVVDQSLQKCLPLMRLLIDSFYLTRALKTELIDTEVSEALRYVDSTFASQVHIKVYLRYFKRCNPKSIFQLGLYFYKVYALKSPEI